MPTSDITEFPELSRMQCAEEEMACDQHISSTVWKRART